MLSYLSTILASLLLASIIAPTTTSAALLLHSVTSASTPAHVQLLPTPPPATTPHSVLLTLTQPNPQLATQLVADRSDPASPNYLQWLDRATLGALLTPSPATVSNVSEWLAASEVAVVEWWGPWVRVEGSVAAIERLFNTTLRYYLNTDSDTQTIRQTGDSYLPTQLHTHIASVDGLHTDDIVSPVRAIVHERPSSGRFKPMTYRGCYTSAELAIRYGTPNTITATANNSHANTSVAVIQLSNDENYNLNALYRYGQLENYTITNLSTLVTAIQLVSPNAANSATIGTNDESMLDLEAVVSVTTTSSVYAMKVGGSDANQPGNLFGYFLATSPLPQVMSLSYSYAESQFRRSDTVSSYENQVAALAALGVTFLAATGDSGYNVGIGWPATSAYVLAVGGTTFSQNGATITEAAWDGSTGGLSSAISRPSYQTTANTGIDTGYRAVPDVSALAANWFLVYGTAGNEGMAPVGGTSLATPLWAGVVTYLNEISLRLRGSTLGFINPLLYTMAANCSGCFHDITTGSSNSYNAKVGYDLVTGLGSPYLPAMEAYLTALLNGTSAPTTAPSSTAAAAPSTHSSSTAASSTIGQCTLNPNTTVGTFNDLRYRNDDAAPAGSLYTTAVTLTSPFNVAGLGIQLPAARGRQGRGTSVVQLALYEAIGRNSFELLASTSTFSVTSSGGEFTLPLSGGGVVGLSSGVAYVALYVVQSTSVSGVLVYADNSYDEVIGPTVSGVNGLPIGFSSVYGNWPFRVELLSCA